MNRFHLNTLGFDALQRTLYRQSDCHLEEQAGLIRTNFIQWMEHNFELNAGQIAHLKSMPAEAIFKLADQTAIAVRGRLKVTLIKPEVKPVVGYDSKLIEPKQLVNVLALDDDEFEAEGELIIEISY